MVDICINQTYIGLKVINLRWLSPWDKSLGWTHPNLLKTVVQKVILDICIV
jgi:hypothetical protein